jgi:hypothetical protein
MAAHRRQTAFDEFNRKWNRILWGSVMTTGIACCLICAPPAIATTTRISPMPASPAPALLHPLWSAPLVQNVGAWT